MNKKKPDKESTANLAWRLLLICAISALLLGATYQITAQPIKLQEETAQTKANRQVLASADSFEQIKLTLSEEFAEVKQVSTGFSADKPCGYVVTVSTKGYNSGLVVAVGIDLNGTVTGVYITSMQETPGLGSNAAKPEFTSQFEGAQGSVNLSEIDTISGATLTSKGVTNAVNTALKLYSEVLSKESK